QDSAGRADQVRGRIPRAHPAAPRSDRAYQGRRRTGTRGLAQPQSRIWRFFACKDRAPDPPHFFLWRSFFIGHSSFFIDHFPSSAVCLGARFWSSGFSLLRRNAACDLAKHFCAFSWEHTHPVHHEDAKKSFAILRVFAVRFFWLRRSCSVFICVHRWFHFVQYKVRENCWCVALFVVNPV